MAVRNFAELGNCLIQIATALMENKDLVKYLYYEDKDPLNHVEEPSHEEVFNKRIRFVPAVLEDDSHAKSTVAVYIDRGELNDNEEFINLKLVVEVFIPRTQLFIKGTNLRSFAIMGEIVKSLKGLPIDGLGVITGGQFFQNFLTSEIIAFEMGFWFTTYA